MEPAYGTHELTNDELFQEWEAEQRALNVDNPVTRDTRTEKYCFNLRRNKIWVQNLSGCDVIVFADRYSTLKDIMKAGLEVGAEASGGKFAVNFERTSRTAPCTMKLLSANNTAKEMICLGSGDTAGYVSAARNDDIRQLFCRNEPVKPGWCLMVLNNNTFLNPDLKDTAVTSVA